MLMLHSPLFETDLEALFDGVWRGTRFNGAHGMRWLSERQRPDATWEELEDRLVLELAVPGLHQTDLHIEVVGNRLDVKAARTVAIPEGYQPVRRERSGWALERSWTLPREVDVDGVTARLEDGMLVLELPKRPAEQPRQIEVQRPVAQIGRKEVK